jgi:hypothetical protein
MTDEQDFEVFYKAYPRKVAKGDARKAWAQTKKIRPGLNTILQAIQAQSKTEQWTKDNHAYIPYPATWLRAERWDDEIEVTIPGVVAGKDWRETWQGIVAKGKEFGINESDFEQPYMFKDAVLRAATSNVYKLKSA